MTKKKTKGIFGKVIFITLIIGALLIANLIIGNKLNDRESSKNDAVYSIANAAGGTFYLEDVYICIPYTYTQIVKDEKGKETKEVSNYNKFYQAKKINYNAKLETQMRKIGIYSYPVYTGQLDLDCDFDINIPQSANGYLYKPNEAFLRIKTSDKSIIEQPVYTINGKTYETSYEGGSSETRGISTYFNCPSGKINLTTTLRLRGARQFKIYLSSSSTHMNMECDWPSPGFTDAFDYIPVTHEITDTGFTAEWNIPFDGGNGKNIIGFNFIQSVDLYKMLDRAIKYGFLFIIVPFIVLILFELFASVNLHPLHYLLCGAASILFFLLLLSFSEHIGFELSYLVSAVASALLISLYVGSITKKVKFGFTISGVFVLLYGYLFFSLKSEDYALLLGSIFAFVILAVIMFLTRKVDWNALKSKNLKSEPESDLIEA